MNINQYKIIKKDNVFLNINKDLKLYSRDFQNVKSSHLYPDSNLLSNNIIGIY